MVHTRHRESKATGSLVGESYRALLEDLAAVQEHNAKLIFGIFDDGIKELGRLAEDTARLTEGNIRLLGGFFGDSMRMFEQQAEINRGVMQTLAEYSGKQQEILRTLVRGSLGVGFLAFPFTHASGGASRSQTDSRELPVKDYDRLSAEEISRRLESLDARQIERLKTYERRHKNRRSVLECLDRSLV